MSVVRTRAFTQIANPSKANIPTKVEMSVARTRAFTQFDDVNLFGWWYT